MSNPPREPVFPDNFDSVRKTDFYDIIDGEIANEDEFEHLVKLMYNEEEALFYLYSRKDSGISNFMLSAEKFSNIKFEVTEMAYFSHPKFERDFIKINKEDPAWEWEMEVIESSPEYMRTTLKLTEKTRRRLDRQDLVSELKDDSPVFLKPNLFGIGVDLKKTWRRQKGKFSGLAKLELRTKRIPAMGYERAKQAVSWSKKAIARLRGGKP